jgi:hypothetical protein
MALAGFVDARDATTFAEARQRAWIDDEATATETWSEEGLVWAWIESRLIARLTAAGIPAPLIDVEADELVVRFPIAPLEAASRVTGCLIEGVPPASRSRLWKCILTKDATEPDYRIIVDLMRSASSRPPRGPTFARPGGNAVEEPAPPHRKPTTKEVAVAEMPVRIRPETPAWISELEMKPLAAERGKDEERDRRAWRDSVKSKRPWGTETKAMRDPAKPLPQLPTKADGTLPPRDRPK